MRKEKPLPPVVERALALCYIGSKSEGLEQKAFKQNVSQRLKTKIKLYMDIQL